MLGGGSAPVHCVRATEADRRHVAQPHERSARQPFSAAMPRARCKNVGILAERTVTTREDGGGEGGVPPCRTGH